MNRALPIYVLIPLLAPAAGDSLSRFISDYVSDEFFWNPVYNVIDCSESNEMEWIRSVSSASHGFVGIHKTTEALESWVDATGQQTFLLNLNCPNADSILKEANASNLLRRPFQWLLLDESMFWESPAPESENSSEIEPVKLESKWYWEILKDSHALLDAEVRMTELTENGTILVIGVYKTSAEGELIREEIGEWSSSGEGLTIRTRDCAAIRRWDVRGSPLTGSFVVTHPDTLNHLEDLVDKHIDPISKVGYVVVKHLTEMINASLHIKIVDGWGTNVNGTWTGLVGDLQSGAAEVGLSPTFVLKERMDVVYYYELITRTRAKFILMSPPLTFSSNIFTMPFDRMVWLCCVIMILVSCTLLYLATKLESESEEIIEIDGVEHVVRRRNYENQNDLKGSLGDILILNVGAICMQGAPVEPKGPSGRIITIFLYFSYMFLYVSYSGSIVALLQSSDTSIRTFKDLLESPLTVGADDAVYSRYYFQTETEPIRKALYEKKVAPKGEKPHFLPPEEGVDNLRKGLYAFHVETSVGYSLIQQTFTEDEKCGLQEFKLSFYQTVDPMMVMRINTPFTEIVKIGTKRIIEVGINHRVVSRIYTKKPTCSSKGSRFVSVGLLDCYHAFIIILYGIGLALCILFLEKLSRNKLQRLLRK